MENREIIAAANSLIEWFNATSTKPSEAQAIMSKVIAKLLVARCKRSPGQMQNEYDALILQLIADVNERIVQEARGK